MLNELLRFTIGRTSKATSFKIEIKFVPISNIYIKQYYDTEFTAVID